MAVDSSWKIGRRFRVLLQLAPAQTGGRKTYYVGRTYEVGRFGTIRVLSQDPTQPPSSRWQTTETERYHLMQHLQWLDEHPPVEVKVSNGLRRFIEQSPDSKLVRGFVRQELGIVPEKSKTPKTAEGWFTYIDSVNKVELPQKEPEAHVMYAITVHAREIVYGRAAFSRRDTYDGIVEVPASVMQQGTNRVNQWILSNLKHQLEPSQGDMRWEDEDGDITDSNGVSITESSVAQAIEDYNANRLVPIEDPTYGQNDDGDDEG